MISWLDLIILILAAARIIRLGYWDKITLPVRIFSVTGPDPKLRLNWLRRIVGADKSNWLGMILHCTWCLGVYASFATTTALFLADGNRVAQAFLIALAVAEVAPRVVDWEPRTNGER